MRFLGKPWFDLGGILAIGLLTWVYTHSSAWPAFSLLFRLSLISLLVHQVEEYRWPGYFPGLLNRALHRSPRPDRYPLNTSTAFLINVVIGWSSYAAAAVAGPRLPRLGIATLLVSAGNVLAHTLLLNWKGRPLYNPGQATAWLLFIPLLSWFGYLVAPRPFATGGEWVMGVALGVALN